MQPITKALKGMLCSALPGEWRREDTPCLGANGPEEYHRMISVARPPPVRLAGAPGLHASPAPVRPHSHLLLLRRRPPERPDALYPLLGVLVEQVLAALRQSGLPDAPRHLRVKVNIHVGAWLAAGAAATIGKTVVTVTTVVRCSSNICRGSLDQNVVDALFHSHHQHFSLLPLLVLLQQPAHQRIDLLPSRSTQARNHASLIGHDADAALKNAAARRGLWTSAARPGSLTLVRQHLPACSAVGAGVVALTGATHLRQDCASGMTRIGSSRERIAGSFDNVAEVSLDAGPVAAALHPSDVEIVRLRRTTTKSAVPSLGLSSRTASLTLNALACDA
eukprot:4711282-Amphidinium_carterae.2